MRSRIAISLLFIGLAAGLTAACGDDGDTSSAAAPSVTATDVEDANGELAIAAWQLYEAPDTQDAGSIQSEWTYLSTGPDIVTKARSGDFDVVSAAAEYMPALKSLEILTPIDTELLSNYDSIPERLREDPAFTDADGNVIGVPLAVTAAMTAYDTDKVSEPTELEDLLDPAYANGIAMYDDPAVIGQIAMAQGVEDTQEMTQAEMDSALSFLEELKPNIKTFFRSGEEVQLFNSGEIVACLGTFGSLLAKAIENNPAIEFNFLAEGAFLNAWTIPRDTNYAAALNWINETISPEGQTAIVEISGDYPAVPAAMPALEEFEDPASKLLSTMTLDELLDELPVMRGFAAEASGDIVSVDEVARAWSEYKASF